MQVTLHDKRIVMQVTLHYEAIVMQVTLNDNRIVMQVTLHYEAIMMQVTLHDKRIVMQVRLHYEVIVMQGCYITTVATTPTISIDEVTLAHALGESKHTKPKAKAKGIIFHEPEEYTTTTTATIPKSKSQDKGSSKRVGEELEKDNDKNQKIDDDKDTTDLKQLVKIVSDEEEVAIDAIPLAVKPPSIVDWKIQKEGKKSYYKIIRADEIKAMYGSTRTERDYERVLWGDLKVIFDPHVEDEVCKMQQRYNVVRWMLFNSCSVHCLSLQSGHIYMLVEKKYPLTPVTITDMLNKKLHTDYFNEMTYQLLKLVLK
uniref:Uncharacterized protein n=1 Tax=Tanacetum cinerariifolium TaxID=118510 RepID=A0A6L2MEW2_TANCI|nr:hypothetical protein [Tanacetum cinerariifolium]